MCEALIPGLSAVMIPSDVDAKSSSGMTLTFCLAASLRFVRGLHPPVAGHAARGHREDGDLPPPPPPAAAHRHILVRSDADSRLYSFSVLTSHTRSQSGTSATVPAASHHEEKSIHSVKSQTISTIYIYTQNKL